MTVHLNPVEGSQNTCMAKLSQEELCQALGINPGVPEIAGIKEIDLIASDAPAGGTTAYSLYNGSGEQIHTPNRASVFTNDHAMSHHFVHQGKTMSHAQTPLQIAQTVSDSEVASSLKRFARWNDHVSKGDDMKTVMDGITSLKVTSGPNANTVVHAVPVMDQTSTSEKMGAMTTLFARNRNNTEFNQQVFKSKTAPEPVSINGVPHVQVSHEAMTQLQSNMKENLKVKPQANGMIIKSTTYGGAPNTAQGPTATFKIKRTSLANQIGMSQENTTAHQVVDVHTAITHLEGDQAAVFNVPSSSAVDTQTSSVQAAGTALFGSNGHTVEAFEFED